ncbi:hypothetical protein [Streptantibioticus cattleyicolor]|uniref:Putative membrane protein n=1 Tax=Streptantibioticus cattleyicolor (strain ATCC 35852 / DSM 46488 / JCM 4925 / NBRC 14057 / NRRL 8057) TaxID=1003195 RepID=F8JLU3_STREN|nr:hypothetical protein [Streptantibioticus cattleyicolor]AEW99471.1 putative membrane protein [Streptantibioticus cattleyicolor NRRL 8057 = DSM 46488]CCB71488.1 conserved protein of unknown function [Streptantibioticus cattleyicolor NRRL 8057 = DSM 46488]
MGLLARRGHGERRDPGRPGLGSRLKDAYGDHVGPAEQSVLMAWSAFTATFGVTRALTYWIRGGHGPSGGGIRLGGRHFHHYNIGIALLCGVGAVALRGQERHRRHPLTAIAYGSANALIVDELMLLLDLEDVYWAKEGRTSVDVAVGLIGAGGIYFASTGFWHRATREVATSLTPRRTG